MKRVVFVDDEQRVLDGLRDMLRKHRKKWEMHFALGGQEGIRMLDAGGVDVLVSDMRMPGIDGVTLLRHAHQNHPAVVRFILSGFAEEAACMRAVPVAHQFLSKPCDAAQLESAIDRALALRDSLDDEALRAYLGTVDKLPSQPKLYHDLQKLMADTKAGTESVARLVERDMAMSAKLLQLVNSGFFGVARRVSSIDHAVSLLGIQTIQNLVLAAEVFGTSTTNARLADLQAHALLTARLAARIAPNRAVADEAFLAGLLHDVGFLVLSEARSDQIERVLALSNQGRPLVDAEAECGVVSHARVGGYLLGLWGLPYPISEAVALHHNPRAVGSLRGFDLLAVVHIADALAAETTGDAMHLEAPLDQVLVTELGLEGQLAGWRGLAAELANQRAAA
ncbi:MAG: HDOD domain-containing protein [Polyangiaceae bacterium]|nr:HDOD domain-containing protein [Polyangiaceae bacterium]